MRNLTDPEHMQGFLIDLDLATEVPWFKTKEENQVEAVGTLQFMAIEILMDPDATHCYRHDLESFFYVFLTVCCCFRGPNRPVGHNLFPGWIKRHSKKSGMNKMNDMENFDSQILPLFQPYFQSLTGVAEDLRDALFGPKGLEWKSVPGKKAMDEMYTKMLNAFKP